MESERRTLAVRACVACRKQKRKCTREVPECSLCSKNGRPCEYAVGSRAAPYPEGRSRVAPRIQNPTVMPLQIVDSAAEAPSSNESTAPGLLPGENHFPALFFLDSSYFQQTKSQLQMPTLELPPEFDSIDAQSNMHDVDVYFNSIHTFLPIVSKLRLYRELTAPQSCRKPDTALLLITMQLHTRSLDSSDPPNRELYGLAKACCSHVERSNILSVRLLQATLLITLYEIANAIYPAAYLSVGHCARLGHAIGIHDFKRAPQMLHTPTSATELEERHRVWWAVIVLDRYVNVGGKNRPFSCDDVRPDELLPADEKHWDQGELALIQPLAVSTSTTVKICPFGRTCQASHLLSRVLRHISDRDSNIEFRCSEALQLRRTVQALAATITNESEELLEHMNDATADLPLFTATALCHSGQDYLPMANTIKDVLGILGTRWNSAREYIAILDGYDYSGNN
ncbi:uncharacterized protein NECHADRAFT_89325 [Fusarium vanettenii 77-13-4]|uniref:Zn(2)-C6 fungal-type domain-containing protein n=1 Tax=Fusarium vanettenii (strain ATCC MYA-4622 / CBS 123669 / FGSC 9596 / NRRL 45880 / 77-13-4) TaxID=660122 RepID=C7ZQV1_FUSV7|nr:uncharacterized protein NECHADRAFT_89325 [Fusarium vanettenii 77-13-4]EEU33608.1 predicted protein [Fusarium vanettenii 77-13-4]